MAEELLKINDASATPIPVPQGLVDGQSPTFDEGDETFWAAIRVTAEGDLSIRALSRVDDSVRAALQTDALYAGATQLTPKFASVDASTSGDNEIVAAVGGSKIRVLSYQLVAADAVNAAWESATAGALTGAMPFAANGGISVPFSPIGHFETVAGEALQLNLSSAVQVSGHVAYVEV